MRADPRYAAIGESLSTLCPNLSSYKDGIPKIPSVPMGYGDAEVFLAALVGTAPAPEGFKGGLPVGYEVGPSSNMVSMKVSNSESVRSIPNIVGKIPGTLPPSSDRPVLLGNHRDAWIFGASDPNSGTAALLEVSLGLGTLLSTTWRPLNTIYLLSWSGEEYGLLGSTGWGELTASSLLPRASA